MQIDKQREKSERDLRIQHDGAKGFGVGHGSPEIVKGLLVVGMGAMGEVEARHVHTSPQKLLYHFNRPGRRSQRAHYLCLGPFPSSSPLHSKHQITPHSHRDIESFALSPQSTAQVLTHKPQCCFSYKLIYMCIYIKFPVPIPLCIEYFY